MNSSDTNQRKKEETQSESIANANARRVAPAKTSWKASCFGREDSDDVGDPEGTAYRQRRRSELWGHSSDEELSDEASNEICRQSIGGDDFDCPYWLLTLKEAVRHFDKKHDIKTSEHKP